MIKWTSGKKGKLNKGENWTAEGQLDFATTRHQSFGPRYLLDWIPVQKRRRKSVGKIGIKENSAPHILGFRICVLIGLG